MPLPRPKLYRRRREPKERPNVISRFCVNFISLLTTCFKKSDSNKDGVKVGPKRSKAFIAKIKKSSTKVGVLIDDGEQPGPSGYNKEKHNTIFIANNDAVVDEPDGIWTPVEKFEPEKIDVDTMKRKVKCGKSLAHEATSGISLNANDNGLNKRGTTLETDQSVVKISKITDEPIAAKFDSSKALKKSPDNESIELKSNIVKLEEFLDDAKEVSGAFADNELKGVGEHNNELEEPMDNGKEKPSGSEDKEAHSVELDSLAEDLKEFYNRTEKDVTRCSGIKDEISSDHPAVGMVPSQTSAIRCKSPVARQSCSTPKFVSNNVKSSQSITFSHPNSILETISEMDILKKANTSADNDKHSSHGKESQALLEDIHQPSRRIQVMQVNDMKSKMTDNAFNESLLKSYDRPKTSCLSQKALLMRSVSTAFNTIKEEEGGEEEEDTKTNSGKNLLCESSQCIALDSEQNTQQSERSMKVLCGTQNTVEEDKTQRRETHGDELEEQIYGDIMSTVLCETVVGFIEGSETKNDSDIDRLSKVLSDEAIRQALKEESKNLPSELGDGGGEVIEISQGKATQESNVCDFSSSSLKDDINRNDATSLNFGQTSTDERIDDTADMSALLDCWTEEAIRDALKGPTITKTSSSKESITVVTEHENLDFLVQESSDIADCSNLDSSVVDLSEIEDVAKQLVDAALNNAILNFMSCQ